MIFLLHLGKIRTNPRGCLPVGQRLPTLRVYSGHTHGILTAYPKRHQGDIKETSRRHHGAGMVGRRGASVRRVGSDGARPCAGSRAGCVGRREAVRGERGAGRRRRDGFGRGGAQAARSVRKEAGGRGGFGRGGAGGAECVDRGGGAARLRAWRGGGGWGAAISGADGG